MSENIYSIESLADITGLTRRTIRYYIQEKLLAPPIGTRRAAHYTAHHLERLLAIRRLAQEGLTLEAIRRKFGGSDAQERFQQSQARPGTARSCVHMTIAEGIELMIDPACAKLSDQMLQQLLMRLRSLLVDERGC